MSTPTRRRWRRTKPRTTTRPRSSGFFDFLGDVVEGIFDFFD